MPDAANKVYGFASEEDIQVVIRAARQVRSHGPLPMRRRARYPIAVPAAVTAATTPSACDTIRFQIITADPLTRSALCLILARPVSCGINDIPDTVLAGLAVEVCDPGGCYFNEPNAKMVGRDGWAKYVLPIPSASICQVSQYYTTPEWEVFALCCAVDACTL